MRARLRERVSSPCGDDGEVELDNHPTGGGGCAALLIPSRYLRAPPHVLPRAARSLRNGALAKIRIVLLFITAVPNTKLCAWGEEDSGGHVL